MLSVGIGLAFAAMPNLIVDAVPPAQTGEATGFNALVRSVGSSLGLAGHAPRSSPAASSPAPAADRRRGYTTAFLRRAPASPLVAALVAALIPRRPRRAGRRRDTGAAAPLGEPAYAGALSAAPTRDPRPTRSRNRERVVAAAAEVFAEKGIDAGVPEIAARAGVGKATVYRSFPTKEHLVAAVAVERLEWFPSAPRPRRRARRRRGVRRAAGRRSPSARPPTARSPAAWPRDDAARARRRARERPRARSDRLMARAQAEGGMRADATADDVRVLFTGMSQVLRSDGERDPAVWRRYARLIADALRCRSANIRT